MNEHELSKKEFDLFRDLIHKLTGIALTDNKQQLVKSRLQRRLRALHLPGFRAYYDLVAAQKADSAEVTELVNAVTTNKTDFFREQHHFDFVARQVIPEAERLARQNGGAKRLRVWHAGCSTGEEPYTLAITLAEALGRRHDWDVRQLASDIDTQVLAHAERGVYEQDRVETVPPALLRKYFLKGRGAQADYVKVRAELQQQITFKRINLLDATWPIRPGAKFDMLFCRNVVIYFDKPTRQKLFARYAEMLRPGGYLFIGHSESLIGISDRFESIGKTIYRLPAASKSATQGDASTEAGSAPISKLANKRVIDRVSGTEKERLAA